MYFATLSIWTNWHWYFDMYLPVVWHGRSVISSYKDHCQLWWQWQWSHWTWHWHCAVSSDRASAVCSVQVRQEARWPLSPDCCSTWASSHTAPSKHWLIVMLSSLCIEKTSNFSMYCTPQSFKVLPTNMSHWQRSLVTWLSRLMEMNAYNVAREMFDVDIYPCLCCSAPVPGSVSTSPCKYPAYYWPITGPGVTSKPDTAPCFPPAATITIFIGCSHRLRGHLAPASTA